MSVKSTVYITRQFAMARIRMMERLFRERNYREIESASYEPNFLDLRTRVDTRGRIDVERLDTWTDAMLADAMDEPLVRRTMFENYLITDDVRAAGSDSIEICPPPPPMVATIPIASDDDGDDDDDDESVPAEAPEDYPDLWKPDDDEALPKAMRCPGCGYDYEVIAQASTWLSLTSDGGVAPYGLDPAGYVDYDENNQAWCPECGYKGRLDEWNAPDE